MSAAVQSLLADLKRHVHLFDLDQDGLADRLMDAAVGVMKRDMDAETDPDGSRWPDLSDAYAEYKAKVAPGAPMAVLHENMKTAEQLRGEWRITETEAVMVFGTNEQAKQEAEWFQDGEEGRQPPRPFYAFSIEALTRFDHLFDQRLSQL